MQFTKDKLDGFVLNIEFLLISVVQGVALSYLASAAAPFLSQGTILWWVYIFSGFLFILLFWSQAIVHALSFIDWPLSITHGFLYFLASFFEVIAFFQIGSPLQWFIFVFLFFLTAGILYVVDYALIRKREKKFHTSSAHEKLYRHIAQRQRFELSVLVPLGLLYNLFCILAIYFYPQIFIKHNYHVILGIFQALFSILLLITSLKNFKKRAQLISDCIEK